MRPRETNVDEPPPSRLTALRTPSFFTSCAATGNDTPDRRPGVELPIVTSHTFPRPFHPKIVRGCPP